MEREIFEIILEQREEEQKAGRNVTTSGQQEEEVNKWPTSRRQHDFFITIIKSKRDQNSRGSKKTYGLGHGKQSSSDEISGEDNCFCIFFFPERLLMLYRLILCILEFSMF